MVAIVGQVGAGKSSILSAILGEMIKVKGQVNVKVKLIVPAHLNIMIQLSFIVSSCALVNIFLK